MIFSNIFFLVKFILLVAIVVVNGGLAGFLIYSDVHKTCQCGTQWYREAVIYDGLGICLVSVIALFTPIIKLLTRIPIIGSIIFFGFLGMIGLMIYATQKLLAQFDNSSCNCAYKSEIEKVATVFGWLSTTTMVVLASFIICIVILYIF